MSNVVKLLLNPLVYMRLCWMTRIKEGRYSYIWAAMDGQTYADVRGWGINGD